jgi:hypothetical protein
MEHSQEVFFKRISVFSDEIIGFLRKNVNPNIDESKAKWEYFESERPPIFFVVKNKKDQSLGAQALIHINAFYKGKKTFTGKSECTFLDDSLRGSTIFKDLYHEFMSTAKNENVELIWGLTSATKIWKNKLSFDFADFVIEDFKLSNSPNYKAALKKSKIHQYVASIIDRYKLRVLPTLGLTIREISELSHEDVEWRTHVLNELKTVFFIGVEKDYFDWRLKRNPFVSYKIWKIEKGQDLLGYIISSQRNNRFVIHEWITSDIPSIGTQLNLIRKNLVSVHQEIYYFGNLNHPINDGISRAWIEQGGVIKTSNWAGLVVKSNTKEVDAMNVKEGLINLLWTEGVN